MGYDISYHPVTETEMNDWYFGIDFTEILDKNYSAIDQLAIQFNIEDFYRQKYADVLDAAVNTDPETSFENSHGYYMAVIQGFFRTYYYTRGSAFSFLISDKPYFQQYTKDWEDILTYKYENPITNRINLNYSSGVYLPKDKVVALLNDYESDAAVRQDLNNFFSDQRINVFLKALNFARENGHGLLEATEVVEPNPLDLNASVCYSNLFHCDPEGAHLYQQAAQEQLREIENRENLSGGHIAAHGTYEKTTIPLPKENQPKKESKGFFQRLFGK
jgi:hypothetical protein